MEETKLLRDIDEQTFSRLLFERPISQLHMRKVGILAGQHAGLKKVSDCYQIINILHHQAVLIAQANHKSHTLPADVFLEPTKNTQQVFANTDLALESLSECGYVVLGMDLEINSIWQLFLERLLSSRTAPIVFTNESIRLAKTSANAFLERTGDVYICDTKKILELIKYLGLTHNLLSNSGVLTKANTLKVLAQHLSAVIVCVEPTQIVAVDHNDLDTVVVMNIQNEQRLSIDSYFIALFVSLLSDVTAQNQNVVQRVALSVKLLQNTSMSGDFIQNLLRDLKNI